MPAQKYKAIFADLRKKIEEGIYPPQTALPTEYELIDVYHCSRNTVRRAISDLADLGYVQSIHGKGVIVISSRQSVSKEFSLGRIETMREAAKKNHKAYRTKVLKFTTFIIDKRLSEKTGFQIGDEVYYTQRVRYFDGRPIILDNNWFLASVVKNLTKKVCEDSVYRYIEQDLGETIVSSSRTMTVEKATEMDNRYLDLGDYDCVAVVTSNTFNADGVMFEYTQSRHVPDQFAFTVQARRE